MADVKRVYTFGNKEAEGNGKMRELLGGKGANLAEMNLIGIPVPRDSPSRRRYAPSTMLMASRPSSRCSVPRWNAQCRTSSASPA